MINSFLASCLGALNAILAAAIFCIVTPVGALSLHADGYSKPVSALIGVAGALLIAVLICGTLALVVDIRANLIAIRAELADRRLPESPARPPIAWPLESAPPDA